MSARGEAKRSALLVLGTSLVGAASLEVAAALLVVETAEEANNVCMSMRYKIHSEHEGIIEFNLPAEVIVLLASVLDAAELDSTVLDSAVEETLVEVAVLVTVLKVLEALLEGSALPT